MSIVAVVVVIVARGWNVFECVCVLVSFLSTHVWLHLGRAPVNECKKRQKRKEKGKKAWQKQKKKTEKDENQLVPATAPARD